MLNKFQYYQKEFSDILISKASGKVASEEINMQLACLMTGMERTFKIPMLKNIDWEEENLYVAELYKNISLARSFDY